MQRACLVILPAFFMAIGLGCGDENRSEDVSDESVATSDSADSNSPTTTVANLTTSPTTSPVDGGIPLEKLTGTWIAQSVSVPEPGTVDITLTFGNDGKASLEATSNMPFIGEVKDVTSQFHLENGKVVAPGLRDGVTMPLRFEGPDTLILEYKPGKTVRFQRQD